MAIKTVEVQMPDGSIKEVDIEVPDEPKSADQKIREARPAGFDDQTPVQAAWEGFKEGAIGGVKGFLQGVLPGAVGAVTAIPDAVIGLIQGAGNAIVGAGNLAQDPVGTLTRAKDDIASMGPAAVKAWEQAMELARRDPEGFGRQVGEITGATEVAVTGARALPMAPKPVANRVGQVLESVGTSGKWPIRMMGAHQLGSGNPAGLVTMMAPEGLRATGVQLQRAALPTGAGLATSQGKLLGLQNELAAGARPPAALLADTDEIIADLTTRIKNSKLPSEVAALQKEQNAVLKLRANIQKAADAAAPAPDTRLPSGAREIEGPATSPGIRLAPEPNRPSSGRVPYGAPPAESSSRVQKVQAAEAKAADKAEKAAEKAAKEAEARAKIEKQKQNLQAREPRVTETVSAPGQRMTTTYGPPEVDPTLANLSPLERELLGKASEVRLVGQGPKVKVTQPIRQSAFEEIGEEIDLTDASKPNVAAERAAERFGRNFVDEGATVPEGRGLSQDLLDQAEDMPSADVELDIPETRSKNARSAVDSRITDNDFEELRQIFTENPGMSAEDAVQRLVDARKSRSEMYRTRAGMDRGAQSAFDRDEY